MKIIQINAVYPIGSTGKIVHDIHTHLLENGYESVVCYGRGKVLDEQYVYKIAPELIMKMQSLWSKITGYAYAGCYISTKNLINIIKSERPDIVHLHCINSYTVNIYKLLDFLKVNNIPTVLTLHAEFMHTAGCGYALECEKWKIGCGRCPQVGNGRPSSKIFDRSAEEWRLMAKAFDGFNNLIIVPVSGWLLDRAKQSPFLKEKEFVVVTNGLDTLNTFRPTDYSVIRKKHKIKNEKVILHVTSDFLSPRKGGNYVLEIADRLLDDTVKVIIVGYNGDESKLPKNVIPVKQTENQAELAVYYSMADLTLLTSKKETFSMICAESLACGTPVVGFEAGAPETISLEDYSAFTRQGDIDALEILVKKWLNKKREYGDAISTVASKVYSKTLMCEKYVKLYQRCFK
jgi:glycosyltransferase involved in cell wall biosynthesis